MMKDVEAGKVPQLECCRLDRRKVGLISLKDGLDLSTPAGRLMGHVIASVAAFEVEVRSERARAGQAVARAQGRTWGGMLKGRRIKP